MCALNIKSFAAADNCPLAVTRLNPALQNFTPYSAGLSIEEIREKYGVERIVKLASNENPLGASPMVQETLRKNTGSAFRYVQSGNPKLAEAVAQYFGVPQECIVLGNGSDEVIDLLIRAKAVAGVHNVLAFRPCFSMYKVQSALCGVEFRQVDVDENFHFPWDKFIAAADENTAIAFVTTPDNPSGYCPPVAEIEALAKRLPQSCLLVVDEAYMDYTGNEEAYSLLSRLNEFPNVAILRTFSKSFGLAGMRLGFGVMHPQLADYIRRIRPPFSVNIMAEFAGKAALEDQTFYRTGLQCVQEERARVSNALEALGCFVYPSLSNFIMFTLPQNCQLTAQSCFEALLQKGVIIRPLTSYNLPKNLRVSIGNHEENGIFLAALQELLHD